MWVVQLGEFTVISKSSHTNAVLKTHKNSQFSVLRSHFGVFWWTFVWTLFHFTNTSDNTIKHPHTHIHQEQRKNPNKRLQLHWMYLFVCELRNYACIYLVACVCFCWRSSSSFSGWNKFTSAWILLWCWSNVDEFIFLFVSQKTAKLIEFTYEIS